MSYLAFTTFYHTAFSIVAILAGAVAVRQLIQSSITRLWTNLFLFTALVTSVSGFLFPPNGITPAQITGVIALAILAVVWIALKRHSLAGRWRIAYATGIVASLYLLVFVGIVQAFQKVPALNSLAPTGTEPPFAIVQGLVLIGFCFLGFLAARRFHPAGAS